MQLLPNWAPNIHPIIVHLPIAAFLLAVFFDFLSLFLKKQDWLHKTAVTLYVIGAIGAVLAVFTGHEAAEHLVIPKSMSHDVQEHAAWGEATAWFFGIYAAFRLLLMWWGTKRKQAFKFIVFLLSFIGVFLLVETGDHGAKLVFKHGIGTVLLKKEIREQKAAKENFRANIPTLQKDGWIWTPGPGSPTMLASDFMWYQGGPEDLNASTIVEEKGDTVLSVNPNNKKVIIGFGKKVSNIHAEIEFKPENYQGIIGLADQITDSTNYNFILYNNGMVSLGSVIDGSQNITQGKTITKSGNWIKLSVTIQNGNVIGYIDGKQIITGSNKSIPKGVSGFIIKGKGLLLIRRIQVKYLKMTNG